MIWWEGNHCLAPVLATHIHIYTHTYAHTRTAPTPHFPLKETSIGIVIIIPAVAWRGVAWPPLGMAVALVKW